MLSVPSACSPSYSSVSALAIFRFDSKFKGAARNISPERRVFDWTARAHIFRIGKILSRLFVGEERRFSQIETGRVLLTVSECRQAGRFSGVKLLTEVSR